MELINQWNYKTHSHFIFYKTFIVPTARLSSLRSPKNKKLWLYSLNMRWLLLWLPNNHELLPRHSCWVNWAICDIRNNLSTLMHRINITIQQYVRKCVVMAQWWASIGPYSSLLPHICRDNEMWPQNFNIWPDNVATGQITVRTVSNYHILNNYCPTTRTPPLSICKIHTCVWYWIPRMQVPESGLKHPFLPLIPCQMAGIFIHNQVSSQ